jgi:hypothetical protein
VSGIEWPRRRPTSSTRSAAQESVECYYTAVQAPWVPVSTEVKHPAAETERHKTAFERDWHCDVCAYRYSRCYCAAGGAQ